MKKIIFSTLCFAIFVAGYSQSTLAFNQVLLVSSSMTIPANHVWKIEGCIYSSNLPDPACPPSPSGNSQTQCNNTSLTDQISINGTTTTVRNFVSTASWTNWQDINNVTSAMSSVVWEHHYPIWLPGNGSTTTLAAGSGVSSISVIDFIVQ